jgi:prepilin-type N-terminal cleavage/methylation domain-containing protein
MRCSARSKEEPGRCPGPSGGLLRPQSRGPVAPPSTTLLRVETHRAAGREAGFTLVELLVVVGLIGVLAAVTVMMMPGAVLSAKADGGAARVVSVLRSARELAIAQRRNVRVTFTAPNQIIITRVEVPGPGTTVISSVVLEGGIEFRTFAGQPDTPDAFGNATATSFGTAVTISFTSEGWFVDQNGDPVNGTVFIGRANQPISARAVSIFGPTALVSQWRWDGSRWVR